MCACSEFYENETEVILLNFDGQAEEYLFLRKWCLLFFLGKKKTEKIKALSGCRVLLGKLSFSIQTYGL